MQHFEIILTNSAKGWYWTVVVEREGRRNMIAESDQPLPTVGEAVAEAEATIPVNEIPEGQGREPYNN